MLEETGEAVSDTVRKAEELTPYALITRYPGPTRPVALEEYAAAIEIAGAVVRWAEEVL
jgi:HEPN domain-containing protein